MDTIKAIKAFLLFSLVCVPLYAAEKPIALYFSEKGNWAPSREHLKFFFDHYRYSYEIITPFTILGGGLTNKYSMIVMPGGKSWEYLKELGDKGAQEIKRFTATGGRFVGICAGAFYATSHRLGGYKTGEYGIGLLNGTAFDGTQMNAKPFLKGMLNFNFTLSGFANQFNVLLLEGPSFRFSEEEEKSKFIETLATYPEINEPAVISLKYEKGRVLLIGPHPEIEESKLYKGLLYKDNDSEWEMLNYLFKTLMSEKNYK